MAAHHPDDRIVPIDNNWGEPIRPIQGREGGLAPARYLLQVK